MARHRRRRPDLAEKVALPVQVEDPEEALRKLLRQPPLDRREEAPERDSEAKPSR